MVTMSVSSLRPVHKAYSSQDVQGDLQKRRLKSFVYGLNIFTLNRLSVGQYQYFLQLLDVIAEDVKNNWTISENERLPLKLPWYTSLRTVQFDKFLESRKAIQEMLDRCVLPSGKPEVDLTLLPWLYKTYVIRR